MDAKQLLAEVRDSGLTQVEVAVGMGVSQGTISKIERGQTSDLKNSTYQKLLALHGQRMRLKRGQPPIVSNTAVVEAERGLHG